MSNILRRPMFRGGRVESRGTGITSGLGYAKGGQVTPKRGLVDGPGGYAGITPAVTGANILGKASANSGFGQSPLYKLGKIIDEYTTKPLGNLSATLSNYFTGLAGYPELVPYRETSPSNIFTPSSIEEVPIEDSYEVSGDVAKVLPGESALDAIIRQTTKKNSTVDGKDEPKVTISNSGDSDASTVDENDLENMISRYEELLGSKKARQRDAGDMLARASAAFLKPPARGEKRGITEALGDFMTAEAASGPSRTEKISQAAGMLGIKEEQAKDLYSLKQAADKKYSPSITQKKIQYMRSLPKDSPEYVLALRTEKLSSTLASESRTRSMSGDMMSAAEVNSYGPIYYDDWKGQFIPGQSKEDGTYLNIKEKKIIAFKNGELVSTVDIKI